MSTRRVSTSRPSASSSAPTNSDRTSRGPCTVTAGGSGVVVAVGVDTGVTAGVVVAVGVDAGVAAGVVVAGSEAVAVGVALAGGASGAGSPPPKHDEASSASRANSARNCATLRVMPTQARRGASA